MDNFERLRVLCDTKKEMERSLEDLYAFIPEDSVAEGTERNGFINYPSMVEWAYKHKMQLKASLEGIERFIEQVKAEISIEAGHDHNS